MDPLSRLTELFKQFPGIGPRQAKRFVYFLLTQNNFYRDNLTKLILDLKNSVAECATCHRFYIKDASKSSSCQICSDPHRDASQLLIVSRDVDFENIEKSRTYSGTYFILGGSVPILEKDPASKIRGDELLKLIEEKSATGLQEIILALNLTPEGENTEQYLISYLKPLTDTKNIKISTLGRGLSTGLELEYSDSETIKNALRNRH
jgi:recombination protein RecR